MYRVMADEELTKAFSELQAKRLETGQRVRVAEGQISALKLSINKAQLTEKELASLPPGTNTYQSVGRMFLLQPVADVRSALKKDVENAEAKITSIQGNISYWEKSVKEMETALREMVSQRRDK